MTVFPGFLNIKDPERPMNAVFHKLPRSYAADAAWSRFFFPKKRGIGAIGRSSAPWNIEKAVNARD
jgi:hypothetical protein